MPHTPEPWFLHSFNLNFPFAICTNPEPEKEFQTIALITRECRRKPIDCTPEEVKANAELLLRAPRLARVLSTLLTEVSEGFSVQGTTPMKRAMQDAAALVRELEETGVL